jgi:hypothetical protein
VPEEAAVVERIFRWAAEGRSLPSTARSLREEKAPTRNGGAWRPSTIRGMLRNRFYTGWLEFDGVVTRVRHDAIGRHRLGRAFSACRTGGKPA